MTDALVEALHKKDFKKDFKKEALYYKDDNWECSCGEEAIYRVVDKDGEHVFCDRCWDEYLGYKQ
jgi:hypothetical protein